MIFLQKTRSCEIEKKWNDEFKGALFFSHGNSCRVAIGYSGAKSRMVVFNSWCYHRGTKFCIG